MNPRRFARSAAAAIVMASLLTACTADPSVEPSPSATPSMTATPEPSPSVNPTPTEDPVAVVVPSCEELLPLEQVHQNVNDNRMELRTFDASRADEFAAWAFGPVAVDAYKSALQLTDCRWAYPQSDGVVDVVVAELSPEVRAQFMIALDDSVFVKSSHGSWTTYTDEDPQRRKSMPIRYGFKEDVWVATVGIIQPFFVPVMDSMDVLNPQLNES